MCSKRSNSILVTVNGLLYLIAMSFDSDTFWQDSGYKSFTVRITKKIRIFFSYLWFSSCERWHKELHTTVPNNPKSAPFYPLL